MCVTIHKVVDLSLTLSRNDQVIKTEAFGTGFHWCESCQHQLFSGSEVSQLTMIFMKHRTNFVELINSGLRTVACSPT